MNKTPCLKLLVSKGITVSIPALNSLLEGSNTKSDDIWDCKDRGLCYLVSNDMLYTMVNTASIHDVYSNIALIMSCHKKEMEPVSPSINALNLNDECLDQIIYCEKTDENDNYTLQSLDRRAAAGRNKQLLFPHYSRYNNSQTLYISAMALLCGNEPGFVICDRTDDRIFRLFRKFIFVVLCKDLNQLNTRTQRYSRPHPNVVFVLKSKIDYAILSRLCVYMLVMGSIFTPLVSRLRPVSHTSILTASSLKDKGTRYKKIRYPDGFVIALPSYDEWEMTSLLFVSSSWKLKDYSIGGLISHLERMNYNRATRIYVHKETVKQLNYDQYLHISLLERYNRKTLAIDRLYGGLSILCIVSDPENILRDIQDHYRALKAHTDGNRA